MQSFETIEIPFFQSSEKDAQIESPTNEKTYKVQDLTIKPYRPTKQLTLLPHNFLGTTMSII